MQIDTITCIECSGTAHRVGYAPPDAEPEPGDVISYACGDCGHRMDVVVEAPDDEARPD